MTTPEDRAEGQHCSMFKDFSADCILWKNEKPMFKDARDPLFQIMIQAIIAERGGK